MTTTLADYANRRPARADARRNYDAVIAAARDGFAELGVAAPLEEIARRAGVGIGTLYRHFPTREALIEAVYIDEVLGLAEASKEYSALPPWEALMAWVERFVAYAGTKRALIAALNRDSETLKLCRMTLYEAGGPLLERAQAAGTVRPDTNIDEVMRLVTGITAVGFTSTEQRDKVLAMALDGLRPKAA